MKMVAAELPLGVRVIVIIQLQLLQTESRKSVLDEAQTGPGQSLELLYLQRVTRMKELPQLLKWRRR